jgi:hypothetical protein
VEAHLAGEKGRKIRSGHGREIATTEGQSHRAGDHAEQTGDVRFGRSPATAFLARIPSLSKDDETIVPTFARGTSAREIDTLNWRDEFPFWRP